MNCGNHCYEIGGPWIAEDPDCPVHGHEAQRLEREREEREAGLEARIAALEKECAARLTDRQVEDFVNTFFFAWAVWYHDQQTQGLMGQILQRLQGVSPISVSAQLREFRKKVKS